MSKHFFEWFKLNIGSCLSWAITFSWLIFIYFKIHNGVLPEDLNEFGDFIAGAFAPLAFFWLVRGFYQQGKGLKQNSEALTLQADELSNSTKALNAQLEEQRNLLRVTKDQIKLNVEQNSFDQFYEKKQLQPFFHISQLRVHEQRRINDESPYLQIIFNLRNSRAICRSVWFAYVLRNDLDAQQLFDHNGFDIFKNNFDDYQIELNLLNSLEFDKDNNCSLCIVINYMDAVDQSQHQSLNLYLERKDEGQIVYGYHVWGEQTLY